MGLQNPVNLSMQVFAGTAPDGCIRVKDLEHALQARQFANAGRGVC